jgi:hypothetical protein
MISALNTFNIFNFCVDILFKMLRAGRLRGRSSSPGRVKNFLFSKSSRTALGSTKPNIQWVPGALSPGGKAAGT